MTSPTTPTPRPPTPRDEQLAIEQLAIEQGAIEAQRLIQQVRERAWAIAAGLVSGLFLGLATLLLVLRGGPTVGAHLGLLSVYLPGYAVTYVGSVVGFFYAFVIGGAAGWMVGRLYNLFARDG
jgi:hypothetical protein